jgi:hypothetical protein
MRSAYVVMLIVTLIGGSLAAGVPAAFAMETEGPRNNPPATPPHQATRPIIRSAVLTATRAVPVRITGTAVISSTPN